MNNEEISLVLLEAKAILDKLGVHFWLTDGTLLGYIRDKDFISHDFDIDLGVFIKDYHPDILEEFALKKFTVDFIYGNIENGLEYTFSKNDVRLDIFFFYEEGDYWSSSGWLYIEELEDTYQVKFSYPKMNFKSVSFLNENFNIPEYAIKYLSNYYGYFWSIPEKNWHWAFSSKSLFYAPFLQIREHDLKRNYHLVTQLYTDILASLIEEYKKKPQSEFCIKTLQKARKNQADFWLLQSKDSFDKTYSSLMGISYKLLSQFTRNHSHVEEKEINIIKQRILNFAEDKENSNSSKISEKLLISSLYPDAIKTIVPKYNGENYDYFDCSQNKRKNIYLAVKISKLISQDRYFSSIFLVFQAFLLKVVDKMMEKSRKLIPQVIRDKLWTYVVRPMHTFVYKKVISPRKN